MLYFIIALVVIIGCLSWVFYLISSERRKKSKKEKGYDHISNLMSDAREVANHCYYRGTTKTPTKREDQDSSPSSRKSSRLDDSDSSYSSYSSYSNYSDYSDYSSSSYDSSSSSSDCGSSDSGGGGCD